MKRHLILWLTLMLTFSSKANFYVVYLTQKSLTESVKLSEENENKHKRQAISYDEKDFEINSQYKREIELTVNRMIGSSRWLNAICVEANEIQINTIKSFPFVVKVEPIGSQHSSISYTPMVSPGGLLSSERQLQQLQLDRLHLQGYTGKGFTIAVFDNGFTSVDKLGPYRHLFKNKQIKHCKNFVDPKRSVYEMGTDGDHGSRVLSVLAALMPPNFVGAAYDANYLLAITEDMTKEGVLEEWNWLMAAEWADSLGVDIISTSLGYATNFTYGGDHTFEEMDGKTTFISRAANLAASRGILVVNAMGNEGESAWKHMNAPADADSCLAVGSVNADENYSTFSSIGPTYDQRIKPDVVAMGEFTITLLPQGWLKTGVGTSFACPLMAGYAACVWQIEPSKTNMEIFNLIKESGSNAKQPNNTIGWGVPKADSIYFWLKGAHLPMGGSIKNYFTIYPNPGNSLINLSYYNYDKTSSCLVKVYNNLGEQLFTKHFEILEGFGIYPLDMRELHLQKGMYYLKIEGLGSEIIFEKKLMIIE